MMFSDDKAKSIGSGLLSIVGPEGKISEKKEEEPTMDEKELLAHDLIDAVHDRNAMGVLAAFHALWLCLEACEPEEEADDKEGE